MKHILVTGAGGPPGVNFIDSLRYSKEPMYIVGTDIDKRHLAWPAVNHAYVSPFRADHPDYIDWLNRLIEKEKIEFVHPQPDIEVDVLSEQRDRIKARLFLPNRATIRICQNKLLSAKHWKAADIYHTESFFINDSNDLFEAANALGFPFWLRASQGAGGRGSTRVDSLEIGICWFRYWKARGVDWRFIAQKYLKGRDFAFQSLWENGRIVTSQARERLEYIYSYLAPSRITGTPVIAKTVHEDKVNETATQAILAIDPKATGIFCVDLKEDNGEIYPTEINAGRFFTTSFFFTKAGVNMPYYYVKLAYKEELPELKQYNPIEEGMYWLRHIDCPQLLIKEGEWRAKDIS